MIPDLASMIDHTILRPDATRADIAKLCQEAADHRFKAVCVNRSWVETARGLLEGSQVLVASVIGFPLGATSSTVKAFEAAEAVSAGASEIDMVIDIGRLKEGSLEAVQADIAAVVRASEGRTVKVIIEACLLSDAEKMTACRIAAGAGAGFVKTSTGFGPGGATEGDVALMRRVVGDSIGVKASGGIRTAAQALAMVRAGASRLGTSSGVAILAEAAV